MAANVLNNKVAIHASIMLVRVFIKLKEVAPGTCRLETTIASPRAKACEGILRAC